MAVLAGVLAVLAGPAHAQTVGVIAPDDTSFEQAIDLFRQDGPDVQVARVADAATAVQQGMVAVVAHTPDDAAAIALAKELDQATIPMVSTNGRTRAVARAGRAVFVADATIDLRAKRLVAYLKAVVGADAIAILHDAALADKADQIATQAGIVGLEIKTRAAWDGTPDDAFLSQTFEDFEKATKINQRARRFARLFGAREQSAIDRRLGVGAIVVLGDAEASGTVAAGLRENGVELPLFGIEAIASGDFVGKVGRDATDIFAPATYSSDVATVEARTFSRHYDGEPTRDAMLLYESLEFVAGAMLDIADRGAEVNAETVAVDLLRRTDPDLALEGLSGLLYTDKDGVMQRDPWMLVLDRERFRPAYTQLRPVVDPRELWKATHPQEGETVSSAEQQARQEAARARRRSDIAQPVELAEGSMVKVGQGSFYHRTAVVYAGIDLFRVNDVDIAGQAFDVELFLWFRWQGDVDIDHLVFLNQINTEDSLFEVVRQDLDSELKYICYKVKGRFLTPFDLHDFPFDSQRLPIQLSHATLDTRDLLLVVDYDRLSQDEIRAIYPEEWTYLGRRDASATYAPTTTYGDPAYEGLASRSAFSVYQTEIVLDRILFPYLITLFLPLAIMVGISLFVVLIPPSQFGERLTLTMTALLSVVVFHLAQGEDLPNVGYLMRADQYFMIAYILLFLLIIKTVLVNLAVGRLSDRTIARGEWLFAVLFVPATFLLYGSLSFQSPLEWLADRWLRPPPHDGIDTVVTPDEAVTGDPTTAAIDGDAVAEVVTLPPRVERDPTELYVTCNGELVTMSSLTTQLLEDMEAVEIPYTQSKPGGDQLRDCSGNFLRVASAVAGMCPDQLDPLPIAPGVKPWNPRGNNVFDGQHKKWEEDGTPREARTTRGTARWYAKNDLFVPLFHDSSRQDKGKASAMLTAFRNEIKPGMVLWYAIPGSVVTERDGVEKMFTKGSGKHISHMGVVHSVQRDESGQVVGYKLYHGRRAYGSSKKELQDNKITVHTWETTRSTYPPFGNGSAPLVGYASLLPEG